MMRMLAVAAACAAFGAAQQVVEVRLPQPLAQRVADGLAPFAGLNLDAGGLPSALPRRGAIVVATEPVLQVLAAQVDFVPLPGASAVGPAGRGTHWMVPWRIDYALVAAPTVAESSCASLEALALDRSLQDRIALCMPAVDPGPWLLGMFECLAAGQSEATGFGLWTALDARAGGYCADFGAALAALQAGRADVALVPTVAVGAIELPPGHAVRRLYPGRGVPLGLALVAPADAAAVATLQRLSSPLAAQQLAERVGLEPGGAELPEFRSDDVRGWLDHFERRIRGQGRGIEQIADGFDFAFGALFLAVLGVVWWRQRRGKVP